MSQLQSIAPRAPYFRDQLGLEPLCSVCEINATEHVVCVPGQPVSMGYCVPCLQADAHPWGILVAGTAINNGLDHCASWWRSMVEHTITHLNRADRTMETFNAAVVECMMEMDNGCPND